MKPNPELTKRIVELYANGAISIEAVAKIVELAPATVRYHLKKGGAVMRRQGDVIKSRLGTMNPKLVATSHPTLTDIAWAAGVFEGEGSTTSSTRKLRTHVTATVCQKDRWLCDELRRFFGGSVNASRQRSAHHLEPITMYRWNVTGPHARGFLMTIYRWLSPRRCERIREAFILSGVIKKAA